MKKLIFLVLLVSLLVGNANALYYKFNPCGWALYPDVDKGFNGSYCKNIRFMMADSITASGDTLLFVGIAFVFNGDLATRVAKEVCGGDFECLRDGRLVDLKFQVIWENFEVAAHMFVLRMMESKMTKYLGVEGWTLILVNPGDRVIFKELSSHGLVKSEKSRLEPSSAKWYKKDECVLKLEEE